MATAAPPTTPALGRWWHVAGGISMNLALGSLYAWSVFVTPLETRFGWTRTQTSTAFTIAVVAFALAFIVAGWLQDRIGPRPVALAGGLMVSVGFWLCSYTTSLTWLYVCFGVVVGTGNGFGYATPIPVMAKWFPDRRGLAVGLAVAGYGGGSAIFGPLCAHLLIPTYGLPTTLRILGVVFLVMTTVGALLLKNPPTGYQPEGWEPSHALPRARATSYEYTPGEVLRTPAFYLIWVAYALGASAGLMVISQLAPFAKERGVGSWTWLALLVGGLGNVSGRLLSGWLSDRLGRLNVLRLMIGVSALAMPLLHALGGNVAGLVALVFVVYWCFGTQLSVNASTAADFWGTQHAGMNYGMLYTAYGVAGILGPWIGAALFVANQNYRAAFWSASALALLALTCESLAHRPTPPERDRV